MGSVLGYASHRLLCRSRARADRGNKQQGRRQSRGASAATDTRPRGTDERIAGVGPGERRGGSCRATTVHQALPGFTADGQRAAAAGRPAKGRAGARAAGARGTGRGAQGRGRSPASGGGAQGRTGGGAKTRRRRAPCQGGGSRGKGQGGGSRTQSRRSQTKSRTGRKGSCRRGSRGAARSH